MQNCNKSGDVRKVYQNGAFAFPLLGWKRNSAFCGVMLSYCHYQLYNKRTHCCTTMFYGIFMSLAAVYSTSVCMRSDRRCIQTISSSVDGLLWTVICITGRNDAQFFQLSGAFAKTARKATYLASPCFFGLSVRPPARVDGFL